MYVTPKQVWGRVGGEEEEVGRRRKRGRTWGYL